MEAEQKRFGSYLRASFYLFSEHIFCLAVSKRQSNGAHSEYNRRWIFKKGKSFVVFTRDFYFSDRKTFLQIEYIENYIAFKHLEIYTNQA